ncbi:MAG: hypothetical protein ACK5VM_07065, partial [Bacteroidota bacterium]
MNDNFITLISGSGTDNQTVCVNTAISNIIYSTRGASGASFSTLPSGIVAVWRNDSVIISGSPTALGTYN